MQGKGLEQEVLLAWGDYSDAKSFTPATPSCLCNGSNLPLCVSSLGKMELTQMQKMKLEIKMSQRMKGYSNLEITRL